MHAISHTTVHNGAVAIHVATAGTAGTSGTPGTAGTAATGPRPGGRPPVVLLHGFPENHTSWRHQMQPLAAAGLTALAPDLRGYNRSSAPAGVECYAIDHLISDVRAVVLASGHERAHIVGHDWGGIIAWHFAAAHPELVDRLVILNAPHPSIFLRKVRRPPQLFRSWYAAFFQLPLLPEASLRAADFAMLRRLLRTTPAQPDTFSEADIDGYVKGLAGPGSLTAAINYYRAAARHRPERRVGTDAPTLVIWGEEDVALTTGLLEGLERYAPAVRIERLPGVGHWVQNEAPARVNELLLEFLLAGG